MSDGDDWSSRTRLPAAPPAWFDHRYAVLSDGSLAIVRTDIDIHAEYARWWRSVQQSGSAAPSPDVWGRTARICTFDGDRESDPIEALVGFCDVVSRFSDRRWLIAASRTPEGERNARILDRSGFELVAFHMGDGIAHALCSPDGTIWVGYFDEGVFASINTDGSWPVSSSGIARFDGGGGVLWEYNSEQRQDPHIADCYALTLEGNRAWYCFYMDFPIISVSEGEVRHWENSLAGARALAVDGNHVLLAGGYDDKAGRVALLRLWNRKAEVLGEIQIPAPSREAASLVQGQGDTIHLVDQGVWRRFSVRAVRDRLGV